MWCLWGRWESQARHWPCSQWDPFPSPGLSWVSVAHAWYWWHSLSTFLVLIDLFMLILFQRKWSRFFQSQAEVEAGSEADSGWLACCCCSAVKSCLTLCDPMDCSMPGFPVLRYLVEFAQTHLHQVSDAIPPSHPLLPSSPPALNPSQHRGLFQWVSSSHQVTKVLELQLQLPVSIQGWFPLGLTGWISKGLSKSSPTPQFKSISSSVLSFLYSPTLTSMHDYWKNHSQSSSFD